MQGCVEEVGFDALDMNRTHGCIGQGINFYFDLRHSWVSEGLPVGLAGSLNSTGLRCRIAIMTVSESTLGMLVLAGALLVCSAHCLGLPARWLRRFALALSLAAALPAVALAQTDSTTQPPGAGGNSHRPHGPPPEAVAACSTKASGTACSFTDHRGNARSGTCDIPPMRGPATTGQTNGGSSGSTIVLACHPSDMGREGPPPSSN